VRQLSSEPSGKTPGPSRSETRRSDTSEPSGKTPGPSRIKTRRSDTREPSGKTLGPSRSESFAEASDDPTITPKRQTIRPLRRSDTRASRRAMRRARLDPNHTPKCRERAVGQDAGPVSKRTIRRSDTRKPSGSRRACAERPPTIRRASRRRGTTDEPSRKPPGSRRASAVHRAIRCRGAAEIEPNPLDYSL